MRGVDALVAAGWLATLTACGSTTDATVPLPCDVQAVLGEVCDMCHSSPPKNGAPISLVTYADTQAIFTELPTFDHVPTWQAMGDAVQVGQMPPAGVTLSSDQRQTLLTWVDAGAPASAPGTQCP